MDPKIAAAESTAALNAEVLEVLTYRDDLACVISKWKPPDDEIRKSLPPPYDAQIVGKIDGVWKNLDCYYRPGVEAAERRFEKKKESLWQDFVKVRDRVRRGLPVPAPRGGAAPDKARQAEIETWQLYPRLDAPDLAPPAVQWAILDNDPLPGFKSRVKRMSQYYRESLAKAKTDTDEEMQRSAGMSVSWDLGFKEVNGDGIYLLGSEEGNTSLSSNSPGGKKWIVTKIVRTDEGKPVCWCIPVEVKTGTGIHVTMTEDNMFDLGRAFDEALREAERAK